jgi:putative tricarboxylic transport membrane protein
MSSKIVNSVALLLLLILGICYWLSANTIGNTGIINDNTIGPGLYPKLLAIMLVILCLISFIQTLLKKENVKVYFPNFKMLLFTMFLTGLFLISWYFIGFFYIQLFVYMTILFTVYRYEEFTKRLLFMNAVISLGFSLTIYIIFDIFLKINF